jgi:hypothetical protein
LNTVRLQKNSQPSLRLDPLTLPRDYQQATIMIAQPDWERVLALIPSAELRQKLERAVVTVEPNKELIRAMPPNGHLQANIIDAFQRWVMAGMPQTAADAAQLQAQVTGTPGTPVPVGTPSAILTPTP